MLNNSVKIREMIIGEGKPKICVSIIGSNTDEVLNQARAIVQLNEAYVNKHKSRENKSETKIVNNLKCKIIDIVEWRVDFFDDVFKTDIVLDTLKKLRAVLAETLILVTFRTSKEGGNRRISPNDYIQLNCKIVCSELADMIDVEAFSFVDEDENNGRNMSDCQNENMNKTRNIQVNQKRSEKESNYKQEEIYMVCQVAQKLIDICVDLNKQKSSNKLKENKFKKNEFEGSKFKDSDLKENEFKKNKVKVICSYHNFEKTPSKSEITGRLIAMQKAGPDMLKIAVMPNFKEDVMVLMEATMEMNQNYAQKPMVTMSMGKLGSISRVMGQFIGSAITFGTIGTVSAPGQIEAGKLNDLIEQLAELY